MKAKLMGEKWGWRSLGGAPSAGTCLHSLGWLVFFCSSGCPLPSSSWRAAGAKQSCYAGLQELWAGQCYPGISESSDCLIAAALKDSKHPVAVQGCEEHVVPPQHEALASGRLFLAPVVLEPPCQCSSLLSGHSFSYMKELRSLLSGAPAAFLSPLRFDSILYYPTSVSDMNLAG